MRGREIFGLLIVAGMVVAVVSGYSPRSRQSAGAHRLLEELSRDLRYAVRALASNLGERA
jgi:hypothetical protein